MRGCIDCEAMARDRDMALRRAVNAENSLEDALKRELLERVASHQREVAAAQCGRVATRGALRRIASKLRGETLL